jgi:hypothetical protein
LKLLLDNELLFEIEDKHLIGLSHIFNKQHLKESIFNTLQWHAKSLCEEAIKSMLKEWLPHLKEKYADISYDEMATLQLIKLQVNYKDKERKEYEAKAEIEAKWTTD